MCGELGSLGHQKTLEEVEGEHRMEGAFQVEEVGQYSLAEAVEEEEEEEEEQGAEWDTVRYKDKRNLDDPLGS